MTIISLNCVKIYNFLYKYYSVVRCCPVVFSSKEIFKRTLTSNKFKLFMYIISRLLEIASAIQLFRIIMETIFETTGNIDFSGLIGMSLWLIALTTILIGDYMSCDAELNFDIKTLSRLLTEIWKQSNSNDLKIRKINSKIVKRLLLLISHSAITDYLVQYNFATSTFGNLELDPSLLYTALPWRTTLVDTICWICSNVNMFLVTITWSSILALPGALAYILEASIELLAYKLKTARTYAAAKSVLDTYTCIIYCTENGLRAKIGRINLAFYLVAGFQQFFESYFLFQLIKLGAAWDDYQFLLTDLTVSNYSVYCFKC